MSDFLTCPQLAKKVRYSDRQVRRLAQTGRIPDTSVTIGGHFRFKVGPRLDEFIAETRNQGFLKMREAKRKAIESGTNKPRRSRRKRSHLELIGINAVAVMWKIQPEALDGLGREPKEILKTLEIRPGEFRTAIEETEHLLSELREDFTRMIYKSQNARHLLDLGP